MAISDQTAREIVKIIRKHVDQQMLDQIIDGLQEVRGDKGFRDTVQLFAQLAQRERSSSTARADRRPKPI